MALELAVCGAALYLWADWHASGRRARRAQGGALGAPGEAGDDDALIPVYREVVLTDNAPRLWLRRFLRVDLNTVLLVALLALFVVMVDYLARIWEKFEDPPEG